VVVLGIGGGDADRLCEAVPPLGGLPAGGDGTFGNKIRVAGAPASQLVTSKQSLHLSVYRRFGFDKRVADVQFGLAREAGGV
jgi:hypothetical protein